MKIKTKSVRWVILSIFLLSIAPIPIATWIGGVDVIRDNPMLGVVIFSILGIGILISILLVFIYWRCPKCDELLGRGFVKYCSSCGENISDQESEIP